MAKVFLTAINDTLKRIGSIQGDAGELVTGTGTDDEFTDSARQREIDVAIQLWNETTHTLYDLELFAAEASTATITLADGTREYDLPTDFLRFAGNEPRERAFRATDGRTITEYKGGYARMLVDQVLATDFTGQPNRYAINPTKVLTATRGGTIRFDAEPTSDEDGDTLNALYDRFIEFTSTMATETFPFNDAVVTALVPVVAQYHSRDFKKDFDEGIFRSNIVRAVSYLSQKQKMRRHGRR